MQYVICLGHTSAMLLLHLDMIETMKCSAAVPACMEVIWLSSQATLVMIATVMMEHMPKHVICNDAKHVCVVLEAERVPLPGGPLTTLFNMLRRLTV